MLDASGTIRDLSGMIADLAGDVLSPAGLAKLAALDPSTLPAVSGKPRIGPPVTGMKNLVCIGLNYADHAAETGAPVPKEPIVFLKSLGALQGPNDDIVIPRGIEDRLGSRARHHHRHQGEVRDRGHGARPRRRLCRRQRRLRARVAVRARHHLGQGQGLRHLRPPRPLAGDQGRGAGPAEPGDVHRRRRRAPAGRHYPHDDLRREEADRLCQPVHHAASGRRDLHRHAAGRGPGQEADAGIPEGGPGDSLGIAGLGEQQQNLVASE